MRIVKYEVIKARVGALNAIRMMLGSTKVFPTTRDYSREYLTFEVLTPGTITVKTNGSIGSKTFQYRVNGGEWTSITSGSTSNSTVSLGTFVAKDKIELKGTNTTYATSKANYMNFQDLTDTGTGTHTLNTGSATYNICGNIMSMTAGDNFIDVDTIPAAWTFCSLFKLSAAVDASKLVLPASTLTANCYRALFSKANLEVAPEILPATTLANDCYWYMFEECLITKAPILPYTGSLVTDAYGHMFLGCTNLNYICCLATNISATKCTEEWVKNVAASGTFVKNADMSSWTTGVAGIPTGWTVQDYVPEDNTNYLKFRITQPGNIVWKAEDDSNTKTISYSINKGAWTSITSTTSGVVIPVEMGDIIRFKGDNTSYCDSSRHANTFDGTTAEFIVSGNIMSLLYENDIEDKTTLSTAHTFEKLFKNCRRLRFAGNLILPATTLSVDCYTAMFQGCSSLTVGPALPATTLTEGCYSYMFYGCSSLVQTPELPATTMTPGCYKHMFYDCVSLTTAPVLPALALDERCYSYMFSGCTGLTTAPELNATTLDEYCYEYMFSGCTGLTTAPELEASILVEGCYQGMFYNCSNLNSITCPAVDISATDCTTNWVYGVAATGVFGKDSTMTAWTTSANGVPTGWTVVDAGHDYALDYLTFKILTSGTIGWKAAADAAAKTIQYSINEGEWTSITSTTDGVTISVSAGDEVRFKGENTGYATSNSSYSGFGHVGTATYDVKGNIMSLLYGDNFIGQTTLSTNYTFCCLFDSAKVVSAKNLILPAMTMTAHCYRALFANLPTLTEAPAFPATTLADNCYRYTFNMDTSLVRAPELLVETLISNCYYGMFNGCTSLNYIKCLATNKSASDCTKLWVGNGVGEVGTFVKSPDITVSTWGVGANGIPTGWVVYDSDVLYDPEITCDGEVVTITCDSPGATIYYRLNETGSFSQYNIPFAIYEDTVVEAYSEFESNRSNTVIVTCHYIEHIYKFGDLKIAPGPLYYGADGYEIKDGWNYSSYNSVYGKAVGSTYFNFLELGELFEKTGFTTSDEDIENCLDPLDGWRLPTKSEWENIIGTTRAGSTVNGTASCHWVGIYLSDVVHAGASNPFGILIFPDGETINGDALVSIDTMDAAVKTTLTQVQLNTYLNQGCVFLPTSGEYYAPGTSWYNNGYSGYYGSSTQYNTSDCYECFFDDTDIQCYQDVKSGTYFSIRLVKDTSNGEETPFEASNKSINTWEI